MATQKDGKPSKVTEDDYRKFNRHESRDEPNERQFERAENLEFLEKKHEYVDPMEYPRNEKEQGLIVIFNQIEFDIAENRKGSDVDESRLIRTFSRLYFNIKKEYIFRNSTRKEMDDAIKKICAVNYSVNCLICVLMTHGGEKNTLYLKDGQMFAHEIYETFCMCDSFKNIPKLFIFQACKTKNSNSAQTVDNFRDTKLIHDETWKRVIPPHTLLFYSSLEGEVSFRHQKEGTWFIQELCNNIDSHGRDEDVHSLATRVIKCVACNYYYEDKDIDETQKQMPIFLSTLTKKFYLTMSKRRQNNLMKLESIRNIP